MGVPFRPRAADRGGEDPLPRSVYQEARGDVIRALDAVCNAVWAVQRETLETILQVASLSVEDRTVDETLRRLDAIAAQRGDRLQNTHTVRVDDGVAVIPITGPMFRHADLFSEISGAVSTETLAKDFRVALGRDDVRAVVFDIDSPGGEASGVDDFAALVYAVRGKKPIEAYVSGMAASGAYWIASACDRITLSPASQVGSVGVVMAYRDYSEAEAKRGVKTVQFVSSQSPNKRPDHSTEAGRAETQARVDAVAQVFIDEVARHRSVSSEHVVARFGKGGMLVGTSAVEAKAADEVGSFDGLRARLDEARNPPVLGIGLGLVALEETKVSEEHKNGSGGWFKRFINAMSPAERNEAARMLGQEVAPVSTPAVDLPSALTPEALAAIAAAESLRPAVHPEVAALKQQVREMFISKARTDAALMMANGVRAGRVFPAEDVEAFVVAYVQAALDDSDHPTKLRVGDKEYTRCELEVHRLASRPAHGLFREHLADPDTPLFALAGSNLPTPQESEQDEIARVKAEAVKFAERQNRSGK